MTRMSITEARGLARAVTAEDRVIRVQFLPPDALNARERRVAAAIERQSTMAVRHVRLWRALDQLKESQP